ncbi:hypothetical protein Q31a_63020 [Aureliella helgolandensis]|uniref:Uncharacterized protein n=1 Tax=Aureliella helgolandensis TaxID=2527968 RepID=A0A518GH48_9BACT|nr:hypothetical protein Q31a_63020 [Aureliella helgolandensis]
MGTQPARVLSVRVAALGEWGMLVMPIPSYREYANTLCPR